MVIVEGLDNTGKTTLVERLNSDFPSLKHFPSIGNKHDLDQIRRQAYECLDDDTFNPLTLWDRSRIISEYVYNPVLKNRPFAFGVDEFFNMLYRYAQRPQLIIWCSRPLERIIATFDEREQLSGVQRALPQLHAQYQLIMGLVQFLFDLQLNGSKIVKYDFERKTYRTIYNHVANYINGR